MDPKNQIEGFFLEFTSEELVVLREELERQGYPPDSTGMKEAILDFLLEEDEEPESPSSVERVIHTTREFIKNNPATIKFGLDVAKGLMGKARR
jgi:hypothetical protein